MASLPFSQACENNREPILEELKPRLRDQHHVLEVGSGTGQHACFFAEQMHWLQWQPTELAENLPLLQPRCDASAAANLAEPKALDVTARPWPLPLDGSVFTANTLHIMPWAAVEALFMHLGDALSPGAVCIVYGPFNYGGAHTSESNARFDQWLADRGEHSAIRDFESVDALATAANLQLVSDTAMPANNRLLCWAQQSG